MFIGFYGSFYYPAGGANDYHRIFEDEGSAVAWVLGEIDGDTFRWGHVALIGPGKLEVVWTHDPDDFEEAGR